MEKEALELFKGKEVKIILKGSGSRTFVLTGKIDFVFQSCIRFRTPQKTAIIDFGQILEVQG